MRVSVCVCWQGRRLVAQQSARLGGQTAAAAQRQASIHRTQLLQQEAVLPVCPLAEALLQSMPGGLR